jgi:hypothetical protein
VADAQVCRRLRIPHLHPAFAWARLGTPLALPYLWILRTDYTSSVDQLLTPFYGTPGFRDSLRQFLHSHIRAVFHGSSVSKRRRIPAARAQVQHGGSIHASPHGRRERWPLKPGEMQVRWFCTEAKARARLAGEDRGARRRCIFPLPDARRAELFDFRCLAFRSLVQILQP